MKSKTKVFVLCGLGAAALALALGGGDAWAGKPTTSTTTGQGIMVNLHAEGTYAVVQSETYKYNKATAATWFVNAWDGVEPTLATTSNTTATYINSQGRVAPFKDALGCTPSTPALTVPTAPAPNAGYVAGNGGNQQGLVGENKCRFLDGLALLGTSYTQQASTSASSSCTFSADVGTKNNPLFVTVTAVTTLTGTYTFNYTVTPTDPATGTALGDATVPAKTAWDFIGASGATTVAIPITAEIAGESCQSSKQYARKYSFSMMNSDGTSRISPLQLQAVDSVDPTLTYTVVGIGSTVIDAGDEGFADFVYATNAGTNGTISLLADGDARTIVNGDSFLGNNDGGSGGDALAIGLMDEVVLELPPTTGDYTVTLTGSVKGNDATGQVTFTVSRVLHIIAPGCGGN
jgi:hypothetical protein